MEKMKWEKIFQDGLGKPGTRRGHTCNSVRAGSFLYVFGGFGNYDFRSNQVHVFETATQTWTRPTIKGPLPAGARASHTCTTVGDNLYIFGGNKGVLGYFGDLRILDTVSHTWISPSDTGARPEARAGHGAALVGTCLFVFGGCGRSLATTEEVYYNDLYELNTETLVWKRVVTSGNPPCARDGHTCSSWNSKMIVIGGQDEDQSHLSDVHVFDAETLVWKELITSGQKLPPRSGHSTVAMGKNLFVFGGFSDTENLHNDVYTLDIESAIWIKVATTGHVPSARFSASGDCLDPAELGALVFFGGCSNTYEPLCSMYYLHTGLSGQIVNLGNTRKRKGPEVSVATANDVCDSKPKVPGTDNREEDDAVDQMQVKSVHVNQPTTNKTEIEAAVAPGLQVTDAAANPDPSVTPLLNENDDDVPVVEDSTTRVAEVETDRATSA